MMIAEAHNLNLSKYWYLLTLGASQLEEEEEETSRTQTGCRRNLLYYVEQKGNERDATHPI